MEIDLDKLRKIGDLHTSTIQGIYIQKAADELAKLRRELEAARRVVEAARAGILDVHYSIENNGWPSRADKTLTDLMNALEAYDAAKGE